MSTFKTGDCGLTLGGWPYRITASGDMYGGEALVVSHFKTSYTSTGIIHEPDGSAKGLDYGFCLQPPTNHVGDEDSAPVTISGIIPMRHEPAFPSHGSMGEVTHEGVSILDFFAVHCDLDMHRGPQGGVGTMTAKLVMQDDPPKDRGTIESLKWWAEAESRYRFLKAQAMVKAREWIA